MQSCPIARQAVFCTGRDFMVGFEQGTHARVGV
jgi:hypothetical protein